MNLINKVRRVVVGRRSVTALLSLPVAAVLAVGASNAPAVAAPPAATPAPVPLAQALGLLKTTKATTVVTGSARALACRLVVLQSRANGLLTSAELGYSGSNYGMLRARASARGPWEVYNLCTYGSNYVLRSTANGRYVSAELGYSGSSYAMLRARATAIGPWEQYRILRYGSGIVIRSTANGRYVSAELGYSGSSYAMLRARATAIGPWEQYY